MAIYFPKDATYNYLREKLHMRDPQSDQANMTKLDFLNKLISNWYKNIPFQNIDQLCLTKREKRLPKVQEIINNQLKGRGGVCVYNAIFFYHILKSLNYDVYTTIGDVFGPNDHATLVVNNVEEEGDSYLVEVGSGWPVFAAVPLQNLPTDLSKAVVHKNSFFVYTYIREGDLVVRYQRKDFIENPNLVGSAGWWKNGQTDLRKVDIQYLLSEECNIWKTCVDVEFARFTHFWTVIFFPDLKGVSVKNKGFAIDVNGEKKHEELEDEDHVIETIVKYFPMMDKDSVKEAVYFVRDNINL